MTIKNIISDWDGTIIKNPGKIIKFEIGPYYFENMDREIEHLIDFTLDVSIFTMLFNPYKFFKFLSAKWDMIDAYLKSKKRDIDLVAEIYRIFNKKVAKGLTKDGVINTIDTLTKFDARDYLDKRILNVIDKAHKNGANTGILSEANEIRISKTLVKSGYRDVFDFIVANKIKFKGESVEEFCLDIHRNKDKYLKQIMDEYKLNPEETAYIGDNENDEPCFEMVGYPVVAFMAGEDFKEKCSKKYGAFIPEGGKDLHDFLCRG